MENSHTISHFKVVSRSTVSVVFVFRPSRFKVVRAHCLTTSHSGVLHGHVPRSSMAVSSGLISGVVSHILSQR